MKIFAHVKRINKYIFKNKELGEVWPELNAKTLTLGLRRRNRRLNPIICWNWQSVSISILDDKTGCNFDFWYCQLCGYWLGPDWLISLVTGEWSHHIGYASSTSCWAPDHQAGIAFDLKSCVVAVQWVLTPQKWPIFFAR